MVKLPPYVLARVNALRDAKRQAGQDVIDLGMGNPSEPPQEIVIDKLNEAARDPNNHGYSKATGILNLKREIAAKYARKFGVRLDPESGCIDAVADLKPLWETMSAEEKKQIAADENNVLNGIAFDAATEQFYITGKRWKAIYVGRFTPAPRP